MPKIRNHVIIYTNIHNAIMNNRTPEFQDETIQREPGTPEVIGDPSLEFSLQSTRSNFEGSSAATVLGPESFEDAQEGLATSLQYTAAEPSSEIGKEASVENATAARLLEDIQDLASELASMNMEHRVRDFRDTIPIWANIRSHKLAGREAEVITNIKADYNEVKRLLPNMDLAELDGLIGSLSAPGGVSKLFGSVTLLRGAHRSIFAPKAEKVRSAVSRLRRQLR